MNKRSWINAGLLAAVVILGLVAWLKPQKIAPEHKLSTLTAAEANRIRIEIAGAETILLERKSAGWQITAPISALADDFQVQRVLALLEAAGRERLPATGLARYELGEPAARITINDQTFGLGAINPVSREQYALTQDAVYLINLRYGSAVPGSALQLVSKQVFGADEVPVAFEFPQFKLAQAGGKWQLTPPARDASADDIQRWVDEWRHASALSLSLPTGRKPRSTIKVALANGMTVPIEVMQAEPELILARSDRKLEYRFAGSTGRRLLSLPGEAKPAAGPKPRRDPHGLK